MPASPASPFSNHNPFEELAETQEYEAEVDEQEVARRAYAQVEEELIPKEDIIRPGAAETGKGAGPRTEVWRLDSSDDETLDKVEALPAGFRAAGGGDAAS